MAKGSGAEPVVGVDVGGTNITAGLVDERNKVVAREKVDTKADDGPEKVIERIGDCVKSVIKDADRSKGEVAAVGLGIPGVVEPATGLVLEAVNLRWTDVPVAESLGKALGLPVVVDNDVNVGTWGEYRAGAGKDATGLMGIFVGTGIGGGLVLDGKLYTGVFGSAGEIGHTVLRVRGAFGERTLEQLASRTAIVDRLIALIDSNHPSKLKELAGDKWPRVRSKPLAKAMAADDELTIRVIREAAWAVGIAIANTVTLLSLDCVVVGGGLTEALDDRWMQWIREAFDDAVFPGICRQCKLVPSELEDDAGLVGAALLARERT